jgi:hypothetical protein
MYWAAGCGGCEIAVLNISEKTLDVDANFEVVFWPVELVIKALRGEAELPPTGATTENPYFEVIGALVSRSRIFQLKALSDEDIQRVWLRAVGDPERGYGRLDVVIGNDALAHLIQAAGGDARNALNALELAVTTTPPVTDVIRVTLAVA